MKLLPEWGEPGRVRANTWLLGLNFSLLILAYAVPEAYRAIFSKALMTAMFLVCVCVLGTHLRRVLACVTLLIAIQWTAHALRWNHLEFAASVLNSLFFIYVIIRLVAQFIQARTVSRGVIMGAVNGYLLMGLVFAIIASLLNDFIPGSFWVESTHSPLSSGVDFHTCVYYTFMTLTTVGYGDIIPAGDAAKGLAVMTAVSGPLYLAVVIAFLVGKYVATENPLARD